MKIGNTEIKGKIIFAPMAGFSDSPYRRIVVRHGSAFTVSELVSAEGIVRRSSNTAELLRFTDEERPFGIQLFGNNSETMANAAEIVEELKPDFVDVNAGCSVRRVLRGGSGAGLLLDPRLLGEIALKIVKRVKIPVSVKIRIGTDENNKNYREVTGILEDSGISFLTVHGRTRAQAFRGLADWNIISEIKSFCKIPVIGNGDIKTHEEAMARIESSGCDGVMIGRCAIGNPWIFSGRVPDHDEIFKQVREHLSLMNEFYGERGLVLFRKHVVKYIRGMKNSAHLRAQLVNAVLYEELLGKLEEHVRDAEER